MRRIAIAFAALLALALPGDAQVDQDVLPPNTVVGRLGIGTGPAQAIPFSTITSILGSTAGITGANVVAPGTGWVPGNYVTFTISGATPVAPVGVSYLTNAIFGVDATKVVSATVAAGGTGCTGVTATLTGTTPAAGLVSAYFTASAPIVGGAITNPVTITSGGQYGINPTSLTNEPVTGSSCSGAQLNLTIGAAFLRPLSAGNYTLNSVINSVSNAVQATTNGSGTGLTATVFFAPNAASILPPSQLSGPGGGGNIWNTQVGYQALINSTAQGNENTAFGWNAGFAITSGNQNTAVGVDALGGAAGTTTGTGNANTAIGADAMRNTVSSVGNVAVGDQAMAHIVTATGQDNVAVGFNSMVGDNVSATGISGNVSVGAFTLGNSAFNGSDNTAIGFNAGKSITSGTFNTCIGNACTSVLTTGNGNIVIGNGNNNSCDTPAAASGQTLTICANSGATAYMSGNLTNGHVNFPLGTVPTITAGCSGAGSAVSGTDAAGTVTGSTAAATTCTLTFNTAYGAAPNCAVTGLSSPLTGAITVGTGTIVVNFTSTANYKWSYLCFGT